MIIIFGWLKSLVKDLLEANNYSPVDTTGMSYSPLKYLSTLQHGKVLGNIWSDNGKESSTLSLQECPWSVKKGLDLLSSLY